MNMIHVCSYPFASIYQHFSINGTLIRGVKLYMYALRMLTQENMVIMSLCIGRRWLENSAVFVHSRNSE